MANETKTLAPGTFCWVDIATTDLKAATRFYQTLFQWQTEDMPMDQGHTYTMAKKDGKMVAGLMEMTPEMRSHNVPPHWLSYVQVDNADDSEKKATSLGGQAIKPAFDVGDFGRMAVMQDPVGAVFAVWQNKKEPSGGGLYNVPGALAWNELLTTDTKKASDYYTKLFNWTEKQMDMGQPYTVFEVQGRGNGGMTTLPEEARKMGAPPHWLAYFAVADTDNTVTRAKELGAKVLMPPTDIPTVGRFSVLQDPQGAVFAVIKLQNPPQ